MKQFILTSTLISLLVPIGVALAASATIEENVAGPVGPDLKYVVSPQGSHIATVGRRGSRSAVTVDGTDGPRFDEIATPVRAWVDPRPHDFDRQRENFGDSTTTRPVVFSKDGRRHAYVGRRGQEWVLMVDGKESVTLPVENAGGALVPLAYALEFTGIDGKHLIFIRGVFGGNEMWVDGRKWPGIYASGGGGSAGTVDPLISPDGTRIAGVSQISRDKASVVLDGKDVGYLAGNLAFSADSKNLIGIADIASAQALLVDGKPALRAASFSKLIVAPVGNRIIVVATEPAPDGGSLFYLMVDGKRVDASRGKAVIETVTFSPDGKRYAAICGPTGAKFVIIDGKKGQEYFNVESKIEFSADSSKLVYIASMNTSPPSHFLVVNEKESDAFYAQPRYWLSADGKRIAVAGQVDAAGKRYFGVDGKSVTLPPRAIPTQVVFSPDGQRYALIAGGDDRNGLVFVDGKETGLTGNFMFSPDSKQLSVAGARLSDNKRGVFVDGEPVYENERGNAIRFRSFTPDSQHLLWIANEPAAAKDAPPGSYEWVTYVDGEATAQCEAGLGVADQLFGMASYTYASDNPAWAVGTDGIVTVLGKSGDEVKRQRIKPGASTSVATMIAEAKAAPARAAAKAEEERKKAAEIAAAKKAKADADAAAAASKAKADADELAARRKKDYDDAVAKRKKDYEDAVAKRQADYEALLAKQKADREAALAKQAELLKQKQQKK